jgi:hypothetical protein
MARSGRRKTTPEQWAAWRRTEERLQRVLERRLAADRTTKEDVMRRLRDVR